MERPSVHNHEKKGLTMGQNDRLIAQLEDERDALTARLDAIDGAIAALSGTSPTNGMSRLSQRAGSVGEDKLEAVRAYIKGRGEVRQADITHGLGFNSGTVSTAMHALLLAGEVEQGPKKDRSTTWRAVRSKR